MTVTPTALLRDAGAAAITGGLIFIAEDRLRSADEDADVGPIAR